MKQFVIIVFALLCLTAAHAQKGSGVEFGFAVDAGMAVGNDLNQYTTAGFGGDATLGYNFNTHYALLVRGGYMTFPANSAADDLDIRNLKAFGDGFIKLVGRYNFKGPFYVEPQFGYTRFSGGMGRRGIKSNGLTYAAGAGLFLNKLKTFDASVRYEATACKNGINFVGLRLGYSLKSGMYF